MSKTKTEKYTLLPAHEKQLKPWVDKWIANAMSTRAMDAHDRDMMRRAIKGLYRAAKLKPPPDRRIVFVPSPFVARFAAGYAAWIWHCREKNLTRKTANAATADATADAIQDATAAATYDATYDATADATAAATYDAIQAATDDVTDAATQAATQAAIDDATADATDAATHESDNAWCVGYRGCAEVSRILKDNATNGLECAQLVYRLYNGGNQWSAWVAFLSFFRHVVKLELPIYSKWRHYENAAIHGGPRYTHSKFCIVSDRPETLLVDSANRPHCDTGPFCRWRDGTALYAIHGVYVPKWIVEQPQKITVENIDAEKNVEIRRIMLTRFGEARYIQEVGAKLIHEDEYGKLYHLDLEGDEPLVMVRVENGTPELDGTRKSYWLRVPPNITTAQEAVAWTFDTKAKDYQPQVQT